MTFPISWAKRQLRTFSRTAALDTYSWQALDFYTRLGFTCFGKLEYPNGTRRYYLTKDLIA